MSSLNGTPLNVIGLHLIEDTRDQNRKSSEVGRTWPHATGDL
jgi:hypothetical protein